MMRQAPEDRSQGKGQPPAQPVAWGGCLKHRTWMRSMSPTLRDPSANDTEAWEIRPDVVAEAAETVRRALRFLNDAKAGLLVGAVCR